MGANSNRLSPRQKMINLMYIVLTAMLALNVSSDVLDGFVQVHEGLRRSNENVASRNTAVFHAIEAAASQNPEKAGAWLDRATDVRQRTEQLSALIDSLTLAIVHQADGPNGNPDAIVNRDDLEAAAVVMLAPGNQNGERLRLAVDAYREAVVADIADPDKAAIIRQVLSTVNLNHDGEESAQTWEEARFDQQPVVAAVTLLTKLKNDVFYAEGEVLSEYYSQIDAGDVRVNKMNAFVIPQSRLVMRGGQYQANIVLAAVDSTARPEIYVGGKLLASSDGQYTIPAGSTGTFTYNGYIQLPHADGTETRYPFSSSYTVIEPMATVSATMMNVLYAGIDNPISISVPGVTMGDVSATMTNGSLTRQGDRWIARPVGVGKEAVVTVTAVIDGRSTNVATTSFRIRKLPDPTAYISFTDAQGQPGQYKGSKPFAKASLLGASGLGAAIDDGLIDTKFNVTSFQTVFFDSMGNAMPENSDGGHFSARQKQRFQSLKRGQRFYISSIKAIGPDGITRDLSPIEVIVG
ncbi:MAG: gliding motility protein GldM [Muribaculaceae bacterium]|nr:gliding motility protein GldM [Muribaculaceae bacterium]